MKNVGMNTVGQSSCDCRRQLDGRRAFLDPPAWLSSCVFELSVPRVPGSLGVQSDRPIGLAGLLIMCRVVWLIK